LDDVIRNALYITVRQINFVTPFKSQQNVEFKKYAPN